jgi:hypothetical protein
VECDTAGVDSVFQCQGWLIHFLSNTGEASLLYLTTSFKTYSIATQEAEIRGTAVQSQPGQIVPETLSWKILHRNGDGGVAEGEVPEHSKKTK